MACPFDFSGFQIGFKTAGPKDDSGADDDYKERYQNTENNAMFGKESHGIRAL